MPEAKPHRRLLISPAPAPPSLLTGGALRRALIRATIKHSFSRPAGYLVCLDVGDHVAAGLVDQIALRIRQRAGAAFVGYEGQGRFSFILAGRRSIQGELHALARELVAAPPVADGLQVLLSPAIGYVSLRASPRLDAKLSYARAALEAARLYDDLQPVCYRQPRAAPGRRGGAVARLGLLYRLLSTPLQICATVLLGLALPFLTYVALGRAGLDLTPAIYLGAVVVLLITSYLIWYECFHAIRGAQPPDAPAGPYPPASAIIAAYLPNEAATIVETVSTFLKLSYPGQLEVVLAYNTPGDLPVEGVLHELARRDPRLRLLRVAGSSSKAQNVNAALVSIGGVFVGIFDADHHPDPDSFTRAWRWLGHGYDVVQGHCLIRNGDESWVTRLVAVEFETIYAVAHPGRARVHGFGLFGGSNGYWKTDVLRRTRMRAAMLTEDIDASLRALLEGATIANDPLLISRELAPLTLAALWNQRMRWAQGWLQVGLKHAWAALRSPVLSVRQKLGLFYLLIWRELYPWISIQIVSVLAYWVWKDGLERINLLIPIFVLTTLMTFISGPGQVLFAYLLGAPEIRRHWRWYLLYLVSASLFYTGLKGLISRVAMLKETFQERQWKVTPRGLRPELTRTGADT